MGEPRRKIHGLDTRLSLDDAKRTHSGFTDVQLRRCRLGQAVHDLDKLTHEGQRIIHLLTLN
ncbi:MAG: hypothetical protein E6J41_29325 [Chloroflexi bacterium]|nr:MAG: hypothetical protein E6J41_29325 [Chloroflexota bacterium]